jgi:hypothetical protein
MGCIWQSQPTTCLLLPSGEFYFKCGGSRFPTKGHFKIKANGQRFTYTPLPLLYSEVVVQKDIPNFKVWRLLHRSLEKHTPPHSGGKHPAEPSCVTRSASTTAILIM